MAVTELQLQTFKNAEQHLSNCEYAQAAECYSKLVPILDEKNIWHIEMLGSYAICLKHMESFDLAEEILYKQIELYKEFYGEEDEVSITVARIGLCELYQKQKQFDKAIEVLESHVNSCESGGHITHYYLAINQEKAGQPFLAKKHAKLALKAANNLDQEQHLKNELSDLL